MLQERDGYARCALLVFTSEQTIRPSLNTSLNSCIMKGRRLEKRRQAWDRQAAACAEDGFYALNRDMEFRTEEQRQYWQAELDRAKAELDRAKAELGPRP